ncbi:MAG: hypothetical protein Q9165_003824 [Trypethelium subeluteriae]
MDRRLSYRRGLPLLKPLPLLTESIRDDRALTGEYSKWDFLDKVAGILREHHVNYHYADLVRRFHAGETNPEAKNLTLFVDGVLGESSINDWDHAVQELRNFLNESHLEHIFVEILDHRTNATSSFAINEELYPHDIVESLYTSVQLHLSDLDLNWTTMTLLYRGHSHSDLCPTLLITALDLERDKWWSDALPKLEQMCLSVSANLHVELSHGAISFSRPSDDWNDIILNAVDFRTDLQMGGSIGAKGSGGTGSIGAAVKLHIGQDSPTTFILNPKYGYTVRSPSDYDVARHRNSLKRHLSEYTKSRDRELQFDGSVLPHIAELIAEFEDQLGQIPADDDERNVGSLFASRQGVSRDGWTVNWSLTKLNSNRSMTNGAPQALQDTLTTKDLRKTTSSPVLPLTTWAANKGISGCTVAKRGRTSGWTVGTINKYNTVTLTKEDEAGNYLEGKAWMIFPAAVYRDGHHFMESGDSGSIITQTEADFPAEKPKGEPGVMIGLGFGSVNDHALMSPLSAVFADIEEQTNGVVVEPRKI